MTYLTDNQIQEMSQTALSTYEMTGCWKAATRSSREHSEDEFGIKPNKSAVLLSVKFANIIWNETVIAVKSKT